MKKKVLTTLFFLIFIYCVFLQAFQMNIIKNKQFGGRDDIRDSLQTLNRRMENIEGLMVELKNWKKTFQPYPMNEMKRSNDMERQLLQKEQQQQVIGNKPVETPFTLESISADCRPKDLIGFASCLDKLIWMKNMWKSDPCYAEWGVNDNECSMLGYLGEIEHFCPIVVSNSTSIRNLIKEKSFDQAVLRQELNGLLEKLSHMQSMLWIRNRIERMTDKWLFGVDRLMERRQQLGTTASYRKQNILVVIGVLLDESGAKFADNAFHGGPLGELVQWSDILASLYLAGHDVTVCISTPDLKRYLDPYMKQSHNCPPLHDPFDVVFADIMGLKKISKVIKSAHLLKCRMRVVDSFGTEPEYNYRPYSTSKSHNMEWGGLNLFTKQFYTMFPHTPDNTFLGFVIEEYSNKSKEQSIKEHRKNNSALVYGKVDKFWEGKEAYIHGIHDVMEVHGTVDTGGSLDHVPPYVVNHGILPGSELQEILRTSRVFVGMGFPFEGPAPLEAIANGMVYLNPIIQPGSPLSRKVKDFFKNKPTSRQLRTQHDYASTFIGKPHVIDVKISDVEEVKEIVTNIIKSPQIDPYLPHEFTCFGMMERLSILLEKQNFCTTKPTWPPISALKLKLSDEVDDCVETCRKSQLICEPDFFPHINKWEIFDELDIKCSSRSVPDGQSSEIDYPAVDQQNGCRLQNVRLLFSCAGRYTKSRRVCPCREYIPGQVALCKGCLQH